MKLPPVPILSDLDGTLIDSKASVVAAFQWWAELRGLPEDTVSRIAFGRTSTDCAAILAPHLDCVEEGKLLDERQATHTEGVTALAGAYELLANHQPIAIVTSCPRPLAEARLRRAGLPQPNALITPECWERGKPDPEPYKRGAESLGADPSTCIVLEDAPSGVESGVRAGMQVVAILTSHRAEQLVGAAHCIDSLLELPAVLEAMRAYA